MKIGLKAFILLVGLCIWLFIIAMSFQPARSAEPLTGQDRKDWIKTLQNGDGWVCCDEADGQGVRTEDWEVRGDAYWVYLHQDMQWHKVDAQQLVISPNLAGYAIVWISGSEPPDVAGDPDYTVPLQWTIRCFMPGALI